MQKNKNPLLVLSLVATIGKYFKGTVLVPVPPNKAIMYALVMMNSNKPLSSKFAENKNKLFTAPTTKVIPATKKCNTLCL